MQVKMFGQLSAIAVVAGALSACAPAGYQTGGPAVSPDVQRAAGGAVAGAVIAKALDEDVATGALVGGAAGALCDDAGVCAKSY